MREADFKIYIFWGANMAIRKSTWLSIADKVCLQDNLVHEDQDMSFLLAADGKRIIRNKKMLITTNGDEYNELPKFIEYMQRALATKRRHMQSMRTEVARDQELLPVERLWRLLAIAVPGVFFMLFGIGRFLVNSSGDSVRYNTEIKDVT